MSRRIIGRPGFWIAVAIGVWLTLSHPWFAVGPSPSSTSTLER